MKANWKKYLPWVLFVAVGALLFGLFQHQQTRTPAREITFSELLVQIDEGRVHDVTMSGNEISGHFNDNRSFTTYAPSDPGLVQKLEVQEGADQRQARERQSGLALDSCSSMGCRCCSSSPSGFTWRGRCRAGQAAARWALANRKRSC